MLNGICYLFVYGETASWINADAIKADDLVICADSGIVTAQQAGVIPDIVIGDFDSYTGDMPKGAEVIRLSTRKDDTDSLAALKEGLHRGYRQFVIAGGVSDNFAHTFANVHLLAYAHQHGAEAVIYARTSTIYYLENESKSFKAEAGTRFSVLAYGGVAEGVDISGAAFPLDNATLNGKYPIGLGNGSTGDFSVSVRKGGILVIVDVDGQ